MTETTLPQYTGQPTIVEFLNARLDEQEQAVLGLEHDYALALNGSYGIDSPHEYRKMWYGVEKACGSKKRILADIAAKRAIIDIHKIYVEEKSDSPNIKYSDTWKPDVGCVNCDWDNDCRAIEDNGYPCDTLRLLAQPYSDHPDYREEWAV